METEPSALAAASCVYVLSLPTRNGNYFFTKATVGLWRVLSLPTRNGNQGEHPAVKRHLLGFEPTYKEWKLKGEIPRKVAESEF